MAAATGALIALVTADSSRATNRVPAGRSSVARLSARAAEADPAFVLAALLGTLRTKTKEGFPKSSDARRTCEEADPGACWRVGVSEKSIFSNAYGPTGPATGVATDFGCDATNGCAGRAALSTSSEVTFWLFWSS